MPAFNLGVLNTLETQGYTLSQVFNADEMGLWWRLMPSKSLIESREKCVKNFKKSKDRVILLGCANASGTCKLPLTFIHKSAKPRCYKHMNIICLPVYYFAQKKCWMDSKTFSVWFHDKFVPYVKCICRENGIKHRVHAVASRQCSSSSFH